MLRHSVGADDTSVDGLRCRWDDAIGCHARGIGPCGTWFHASGTGQPVEGQ